ncbi:hypothetical protein ACFQL4_23790 [Halosimplex aquaticum]
MTAGTAAAGLDIPAAECGVGGSLDPVDDLVSRQRVALAAYCPSLTKRIPSLEESITDAYRRRRQAVGPFIAAVRTRGDIQPADRSELGLRSALRPVLETTVRESIRAAVDDEASTPAARVEARVAYDGDVSVTVDPDGFARQYARRGLSSLLDRAVTAAHRTLHATVVGTGRPRERFSTLATAQSRILATATLLLAARCGSQALAAECDLVTAKQWRTADEAVCPVHGTVSRKRPVQRCFGEPAVGGTAYVVGERTPLACSCIQRVVLGPVARTDPRALATSDGVTVKQEVTRSNR